MTFSFSKNGSRSEILEYLEDIRVEDPLGQVSVDVLLDSLEHSPDPNEGMEFKMAAHGHGNTGDIPHLTVTLKVLHVGTDLDVTCMHQDETVKVPVDYTEEPVSREFFASL